MENKLRAVRHSGESGNRKWESCKRVTQGNPCRDGNVLYSDYTSETILVVM